MNIKGEIISGNYEFQEAGYFKNGMAIVKMSNRYGYFTLEGKLLPENGFTWFKEMPAEFSDGYGLVKFDDGYRYMDKTGDFHPALQQPAYQMANSFSEGLAFVKLATGKTGYINRDFKLVIECAFGSQFRDGVAVISNWENEKEKIYSDKFGNKVF
jgi:hypothetical protein